MARLDGGGCRRKREVLERRHPVVFRPLKNNDLIPGAVGALQFDAAAFRLREEYGVEATFEPASVITARWIGCDDAKLIDRAAAVRPRGVFPSPAEAGFGIPRPFVRS